MKVQLVPQFSGVAARAAAYYGHQPSEDELQEFCCLLTMPCVERDQIIDNSDVTVQETGHFVIPEISWP